jgi:hypothetical protein
MGRIYFGKVRFPILKILFTLSIYGGKPIASFTAEYSG